MPISSVFNNAVEGYNRASQGIEKAALRLAVPQLISKMMPN